MRQVIAEALDALKVPYDEPEPGSFVVTLPGKRKLATVTWLVAGDHALLVEAFFCRQPDENHAEFYRFLLGKNGGMYGVHFALDPVGDVYLVGRLPLAGIDAAEVDRVLGCVLTYSDDWFNRALELGFASTIKREWEWRVKRGESLKNLQAFAHFADPGRSGS
ncbi:YbjN domain-containing protein [Nonomuraea sp. NBC_01738]|uniref:YbjN domain-containing protein n=1 Tax=Nonomuraea sp. NBC_01738 TaxID=2976003 RepID=UPI002E123E98|nr:YbjN domain-containing protein [Nonomuraea sp. NBC_01738]